MLTSNVIWTWPLQFANRPLVALCITEVCYPELRTGKARVDGREVVLGTALMLVGGNNRTRGR